MYQKTFYLFLICENFAFLREGGMLCPNISSGKCLCSGMALLQCVTGPAAHLSLKKTGARLRKQWGSPLGDKAGGGVGKVNRVSQDTRGCKKSLARAGALGHIYAYALFCIILF